MYSDWEQVAVFVISDFSLCYEETLFFQNFYITSVTTHDSKVSVDIIHQICTETVEAQSLSIEHADILSTASLMKRTGTIDSNLSLFWFELQIAILLKVLEQSNVEFNIKDAYFSSLIMSEIASNNCVITYHIKNLFYQQK